MVRSGSVGESKFFFFSSRRRHTRCGRDWSSDVCSSDLGQRRNDRRYHGERGGLRPATVGRGDDDRCGCSHRAGAQAEACTNWKRGGWGKRGSFGGGRIIKKKKKRRKEYR